MGVGVGSDAEAIARSLAEGEAERFAVIFDRHFARVHRFFEWRVGRDAADDLAGEVFRVAFERRARYDLDRPDCLPWLYGIAANLLRQRQRSWGRESGALARESAAASSAGRGGDAFTDDVDARVDAARHATELVTLLGSLTDGEREVVLLAAWEELAYDELADALGIPLGTVRSRLHRGRRKLREQLAANGERPGDLDPSPTGERAP
jgi:RNA polymerase sigma factor (sigma-70 family)